MNVISLSQSASYLFWGVPLGLTRFPSSGTTGCQLLDARAFYEVAALRLNLTYTAHRAAASWQHAAIAAA